MQMVFCLCGPVIKQQRVQGVTLHLPDDRWDRLQQTSATSITGGIVGLSYQRLKIFLFRVKLLYIRSVGTAEH